MPCTKCGSDFNLLKNWKHVCTECSRHYCYTCIRKPNGIYYCDICFILVKRPPDRSLLMELKSKDLQHYLAKNRISTHGLVEKAEVVDLFFTQPIPVGRKKPQNRFTNVFGSVPNIASESQVRINNLRSYVGNVISPRQSGSSTTNASKSRPTRPTTPPINIRTNPVPPYAASVSRSNPSTTVNSPTRETRAAGPPLVVTAPNSETPAPNCPPPNVQPPPPTPPPTARILPKISDYDSKDDLNQLSVKQLKELLQLNRINYKGCVEKEELLSKVMTLWMDSHSREDVDNLSMNELCKICMDSAMDCVLLECGHVATCVDCGKKLAECPICRQYVVRVVRTFKA